VLDKEDWSVAENHLEQCEDAYTSIGSSGYFVLVTVVRPLRDRFNKGERTQELYDAILSVSL